MNILVQHSPISWFEEQRPQSWFLWSVRGFCIILLCTYLLIDPVRYDYDIVATVIVACIGSLILLTGLGTLALGLINRKTFSLSSGIPDAIPVFAGQENNLCFNITGLRLLPFFRMDITIDFETSDIDPLQVSITSGGKADQTPLFMPVTFPHRGNWRFRKASWTIYDVFDIWHFHHTQKYDETHAIVPVSPPAGFDSPPPIINSCLRDGDMVSDIHEARGDQYDLKAYHPADGMRKIVWKIYARSGELLARHPEKTMTPEGRVLMAICAQSVHDNGARLAINYSSYLTNSGLECFSTCLGQHTTDAARTPQALEKLLIETAWSSDNSNDESLDLLIENLTSAASSQHQRDAIVSHIIVIGDLSTSKDGYLEMLIRMGSRIQAKNLTPVFLIASPVPGGSVPKKRTAFFHWLTNLFIQSEKKEHPADLINTFMNKAGEYQWEVYRIFE